MSRRLAKALRFGSEIELRVDCRSFASYTASGDPLPAGPPYTDAEDAAYDEQSWTETTPLTEEEKASVLRQMIRANILSEVAASRHAKGQRCLDRTRPDLQFRQEREGELLKKTEGFAGPHRARPSLLRPLASAAGLGLGAVASLLPKNAASAISGGLQEAMVEQYNDQLRELREHDMTDVSEAFRQTVRELRDEERTPPGAVQAPDLMKLQRPQELSPDEILAGVVKYGMKGLFSLGSKI